MTKPRLYQVFYVDGDGNHDSLRVRAQSADDAEDQGDEPCEAEMKFLEIPYSNKEINEAGRVFSATENATQRITQIKEQLIAYGKIDQWRAAHAYPLRVVRMLLRDHAKMFDWSSTVSGRLKRTQSIVSKILRPRKNEIQLSTMQDIAGARAIVETVEQVKALTLHLRDEVGAKLKESVLKNNYIDNPKVDGYRSVHFVVKYQNRKYPHVPPRKIEIQVRTRLQHEWASAVETVDLFQKQDLKIGGGDIRWRRFFALTSSLFAMEEECPIVPGTPNSFDELVMEISPLWKELRVPEWLQNWAITVEHMIETPSAFGKAVYLVEVDVDHSSTSVHGWPYSDFGAAKEAYTKAEMANAGSKSKSAVLVNVDSIEDLKAAYPSYYGNTYSFLMSVKSAIESQL